MLLIKQQITAYTQLRSLAPTTARLNLLARPFTQTLKADEDQMVILSRFNAWCHLGQVQLC